MRSHHLRPVRRDREQDAVLDEGANRPAHGSLSLTGSRPSWGMTRPSCGWRSSAGRSADASHALRVAQVEPERFAVSLWLVGWLALGLDDRPDSLQIKVGDRLGRVPEVDASHLAITRSQTIVAISALGGSVE
jgi:hypothetical protein